jgi:hypothetical protein
LGGEEVRETAEVVGCWRRMGKEKKNTHAPVAKLPRPVAQKLFQVGRDGRPTTAFGRQDRHVQRQDAVVSIVG